MSKPEWNEDTPKWANWLAQDKCGLWWWYENQPDPGWMSWISHGCEIEHAGEDEENPEFAKTLEHRPVMEPRP